MPLDVALLKQEIKQDVTTLAQSSGHLLFEERTESEIEKAVIDTAQSIWDLIERSQKDGKLTANCKISYSNNLQKNCEKLVQIFLKKAYLITCEDVTFSKDHQNTGVHQTRNVLNSTFQPAVSRNLGLLFSTLSSTFKISWEDNPNLIPHAQKCLSFPLPSFPETANPSDQMFFEFHQNKELCDIVIKVGDKEFSAHKVILAARSPFFRGLCGSGMKESQKGEPVVINEVSSVIFSHFFKALYLNQPPKEKFSLQELFEFSGLCNRMGTAELFQWSLVQIKNMTSPETFYIIASYTHAVDSKKLMEYCCWYFSQYSKEVPILDLEPLTLAEVIQYLDVSLMIKNRDLEKECKKQISSGFSLSNFKEICRLAMDQQKRGSNSLGTLCTEYVKNHKKEFQQEDMKESKELYKTFMAELE